MSSSHGLDLIFPFSFFFPCHHVQFGQSFALLTTVLGHSFTPSPICPTLMPHFYLISFIHTIHFFQTVSILLLPDFPSSILINLLLKPPGLYLAPFRIFCQTPGPNSTPVSLPICTLHLQSPWLGPVFCTFYFLSLSFHLLFLNPMTEE